MPILPKNLYSSLSSTTPYIYGVLRGDKSSVREKLTDY